MKRVINPELKNSAVSPNNEESLQTQLPQNRALKMNLPKEIAIL